MHRLASWWAIGIVLLAGCTPVLTQSSPAPAGSPLAKVQQGMSYEKVVQILGPPTAQEHHITAYAFSPLSFGPEVRWTSFHYAKVGRVIFQGPGARGNDAWVLGVEHDPNETGYVAE